MNMQREDYNKKKMEKKMEVLVLFQPRPYHCILLKTTIQWTFVYLSLVGNETILSVSLEGVQTVSNLEHTLYFIREQQ